jgi:signal peptidase II
MLRGHEKLKKGILVAFISSVVIACDYITKRIIVNSVMMYDHIDVLPFLRIVHIENKGAAFGLFSHFGNNVFILISICAIICIVIYVIKLPIGMELYSMSLIMGGAAGNLIDRVRSGKVIDFIDIYFHGWHWPAFNVADSALTVGILLFIVASMSRAKKGVAEKGAEKRGASEK